ncbi:LysR family transcriptional regulator [Pararobbsia alpina]|uniref:LysR family transcriptional regulator n=1 Tax=Pararobbsia alpina TaxID=621374 RepID=UPI0039A4DABA
MSILHTFNLNRLTVFVAVIEARSITGAASRLGMSKAVVTTHLQRLEAELGVALLARTTRQINPTDAGRTLYEASLDVLRRAEDALAAAQDGDALRGTLRVGTPVDFGALILTPMLVELRARHPDIHVELISSDRRHDLIGENIDISIHFGPLADSTLRAVKIGEFEKWLVASPERAANLSPGLRPENLVSMPFVGFSAQPKPLSASLVSTQGEHAEITFERGFVADTTAACRAAAVAGGGIAFATRCVIAKDVAAGRLVRVLPEWKSPMQDIHAVMPPSRFRGEKVRVFLEALKTHTPNAIKRIYGEALEPTPAPFINIADPAESLTLIES